MELYALHVGELFSAGDLPELLDWVGPEKRHELLRFMKREDMLRGLFGELMVRWQACSRLKLANSELRFKRTAYGKPYLTNSDEFHFNISHAGKWVVCALDTEPIGIDVEQIAPIDFRVARSFFSKQEYLDLLDKREEEQLAYFYDLWTLKESFVKAEGHGLHIPLNLFTFRVNEAGIYFQAEGFHTGFQCFRQYEIDEAYKCSVTAAHAGFPASVQLVSWTDLVGSLGSMLGERQSRQEC
ncbi:4'-phosphopantetheinyl transferase superfamily protein [Paenibacillus filicis]|uniref:4'-phosphopantetheinyl transferase superfamily protein n=1 Tax=Paenibacillus filicis TaxID=669464 RepID=A0ABU9DHB7_9BACL